MPLWSNVWIARSNLSPVHTNKDGVSVMVWRNSWDREAGKHLCFRNTYAIGSRVLSFIAWCRRRCVTQSCAAACTSDPGPLALPPASTLKAAPGLSASSQPRSVKCGRRVTISDDNDVNFWLRLLYPAGVVSHIQQGGPALEGPIWTGEF